MSGNKGTSFWWPDVLPDTNQRRLGNFDWIDPYGGNWIQQILHCSIVPPLKVKDVFRTTSSARHLIWHRCPCGPSLNTVELIVIHNRPCKHRSKLQLSIQFTPSRCLDVRQDWYPIYYPEGMKAQVSPVQLIETHRILAPTRDSNQEPPGPQSKVVTTILPLHRDAGIFSSKLNSASVTQLTGFQKQNLTIKQLILIMYVWFQKSLAAVIQKNKFSNNKKYFYSRMTE